LGLHVQWAVGGVADQHAARERKMAGIETVIRMCRLLFPLSHTLMHTHTHIFCPGTASSSAATPTSAGLA